MNPFAQPAQDAIDAHHRLIGTLPGTTTLASEMLEPFAYQRRPDYTARVLAACGPVALTAAELSAATGIRRPNVINAVKRLTRTGRVRNLAKNGAAGRYVVASAEVQDAPRGAFDL